jgi:site-specific DNA-methyltransferase (adenine-specific)
MTILREERIGNQRLILGDCMQVMPLLGRFDHIISDPPFSERTHKGHDAGARPGKDGAARLPLGYTALSVDAAAEFAAQFASICDGWIVWITDHTLAPTIMAALDELGRYVFAPIPFYQPGRSVRLSGDGPCSWTDWIVVSRTAAQMKWGTLRGGYIASEGWAEKHRMGGKPVPLMTALVDDYSRHGQTVLDPMMGGGTTILACQMMGRRGTGIEIDPEAFERACRRVDEASRQTSMFIDPPAPPPKQEQLL